MIEGMGKTVTLDDDVAAHWEAEAQREGVTLDRVVNDSLRKRRKRFEVHPLDLGSPKLDLHCIGRVLDELDEYERIQGKR